MNRRVKNIKEVCLPGTTGELYERAKYLAKLIRLTWRKQDERFFEYECIMRTLAVRDGVTGDPE